MLLRLGLALGVVDQQGAVGALAPILTWITPSSDNTPDFNIDFSAISVVAGNVITLQIDTDPLFSAPTTTTHTLTAPEILAGTFTMSSGALADGTYYARAKITGTSWSNTVTITILAALPVVTYITKVDTTGAGGTDTRTATAANLGTPSATRRVIVVIQSNLTSAGRTIISVTINGVAATIHLGTVNDSTVEEISFASAVVPTGATGDIVVQWSSTMFSTPRISIYTVDNSLLSAGSPTVTSTESASNVASLGTTIATSAGGFVIAAGAWTNGSGKDPITCTGTETYTTAETSFTTDRTFYANGTSANVASSVTIAWTGSFTVAIGVLAWR